MADKEDYDLLIFSGDINQDRIYCCAILLFFPPPSLILPLRTLCLALFIDVCLLISRQ